MGWRKEFGEKYEIPSAITRLVHKRILQDMSWSNDSCPSFGTDIGKYTIKIFVEHPLKSMRENKGSVRFGVSVDEGGWYFRNFLTDDLEEALLKLRKFIAGYHGPEILGSWEE